MKRRTVANTPLALLPIVIVCVICMLPGCSSIREFLGFSDNAETRAEDEAMKIQQFSSRVRVLRGNPESHYLLARHYAQRGRYEEALSEFEKAIAIEPGHARAYNGIAICYDNLGHYEKAREYYKMALRTAPNPDYVHSNIGYSYMMQGDYASAIDAYSKAIEINTMNMHVRNSYAAALSKAGRHREAAREFEAAGNVHKAEQERTLENDVIKTAGTRTEDRQEPPPITVMQPDSNVAIEISNGNGIGNMARSMAAYLRSKGFKVVRCTNADRYSYNTTEIHYRKEALQAGRQIAGEILENAYLKEVTTLDRPNLKVKIVVGRDLAGKKKIFEGAKG